MNSWSSGQQKNYAKTLFSTLHPLSLVIFATATVVAFVLLHNYRFNFHTAWSKAYSQIGLEVTLRPLTTSCTKDYKGHSLVQTSFTEPPNRLFLRIQIYIFLIMRSAVSSSLPVEHCTADTTAVNINTANANVGHTHCPGKIPQCSQEHTCTSRSACCSARHSGTRTAPCSSGRSDSPGTVGCRSVPRSRRRTRTSPFPHRRCPHCRTGRRGHSWGRTPPRDNLNVWSEKVSVSRVLGKWDSTTTSPDI